MTTPDPGVDQLSDGNQLSREAIAAQPVGFARGVQARAFTGWMWTSAYVAAVTPITFVCNAVIARRLEVGGYGQYVYFTATLALGQALAAMGYGSAIARFAAEAFGTGDRARLRQLLRSHNSINTLWAGGTNFALLLLILRPGTGYAIALLPAALIGAYLESSSLALPAIQRSDRAAQLSLFGVTGVQAAAVVAAIATKDPVAIFVYRSVVGAVLAPLRLLALPPDIRRACLTFGSPSLPGRVWRFGFIGYVGALLGTLVFSRSEVVLLKVFQHPAAIGIFGLAFGLAAQITAPVDAAVGPLTPAMTSVMASDPGMAGRLLIRGIKAVFTAVVVWAAVVVLPIAFLIPVIYGRGFDAAVSVFLVAAGASFVQSATAPAASFTQAIEKPGIPVQAHGAGFVVGVVVAVLAIPPLGLAGAVLANVAGQLVATVFMFARAARFAGVERDCWTIAARGAAWLALITALGALHQLGWLAGLLAWPALVALVAVAARRGHLFRWDAAEINSVLGTAPRRARWILGWLLPRS